MSNAKSQISKDMPTSTDSSQKPMSLEEARAVMWLKNYGRPIGELLDEGYLNKDQIGMGGRECIRSQRLSKRRL